jgi:hypothetical protein
VMVVMKLPCLLDRYAALARGAYESRHVVLHHTVAWRKAWAHMATERATYSWRVVPRATPGLLCREFCRELLPVYYADSYYYFKVQVFV